MDIKNVTSTPLRLPVKGKEPTDPYDLDVRIQTLVSKKEGIPNREGGGTGTFTCSRCGSCAGTCNNCG